MPERVDLDRIQAIRERWDKVTDEEVALLKPYVTGGVTLYQLWLEWSLAEAQRTIAAKDDDLYQIREATVIVRQQEFAAMRTVSLVWELYRFWQSSHDQLIAKSEQMGAIESENAALHSRIAESEKRLVKFQNEKPSEQHDVQEAVLAKLGIREKLRELQGRIDELQEKIEHHIVNIGRMNETIHRQVARIAELESQVAAYHAAAARVAGDALRARNDALEEAAKECDTFVEAYSPEFFRPLPPGYIYSADETRAAGLFAHGRFKVAAAKIRALSGPERGTDAEKNARNQGSDEN